MTTEQQPLPPVDPISPRPAAWAALATLLSVLLSLVIAGLGSSALPGTADRYIPTQVARNIPVLTADATLQLAFGTALIVLAVSLGAYLDPGGIIGRLVPPPEGRKHSHDGQGHDKHHGGGGSGD